MKDDSLKPPPSLVRAIASDLRPVTPSPSPGQLALRLAAIAAVVSPLVILAIGRRPDLSRIGPLLGWAASVAQFGLAILVIWIAARESTPAMRPPREVIRGAFSAGLLVVVSLSLLTFRISPGDEAARLSKLHKLEMLLPPHVSPWAMAAACAVGSTLGGGLLIVALALLFRNSLASHPVAAGTLYGFGAGLAINAGWRLACPISTPLHAIGAHGVALIATALLGALHGARCGKAPLRALSRPKLVQKENAKWLFSGRPFCSYDSLE